MTTVPFTAFCPECQAGRTFTIIGQVQTSFPAVIPPALVGCCVCGTSERDALIALSSRVTDDRESLGEISARLNTLDGEVTELRDELTEVANIAKAAREMGRLLNRGLVAVEDNITGIHSRKV